MDRRAAILPHDAPEEVTRVSPLEASTRYLEHLRQAWNAAHPEAPFDQQQVTVTIPASFDPGARELTAEAARNAGFQPTLLEEPQAALYSWIQGSKGAWRKQVKDAWRIHRKRPYLAWDNTWFNAPCRVWPAASHSRLAVNGAATAAGGGKVLLVNETLDSATPYSGALKVRSLFPSSRLIEGVGGTTHAGSLSGVGCVDNRIAGFLSTGTLPTRLSGTRADVRCPKVPPPPASAGRYAGSARSTGLPALRFWLG